MSVSIWVTEKPETPAEYAKNLHERIIQRMASDNNMTVKAFTAPGRTSNALALERQIAYYLLRTYTILTYNEIKRLYNKRNHTTIMHGVKRVRGEMETPFYPELNERVAQLERDLL